MDKEKLLADVCSSINALLVASRGRMLLRDLENDYKEVVQAPIPYKQLGFNSVESFLRSIPHVARVTGSGNQLCVEVVVNEASRHIMKMVQGQKVSKSAKKAKSKLPPVQSSRGKPRPNFIPPQFLQRRVINSNVGILSAARPPILPNPFPYVAIPPITFVAAPPIRPQVPFVPPPSSRKYRDQLEQFTVQHRLGTPNYSLIPRKNEFYGKVTVGDQKFSSTPESSSDKEKVLELAAKEALENLSLKYLDSNLSISKDPSLIRKRVAEIVATKTQGVYYNQVENEYQQLFRERLPPTWVTTLAETKNTGIRCEQILNSWILSPASVEVVHRPVPPLLPEEDVWNVQVDHVEGIVIYVHLADESYEQTFGEFVDNMELFYGDPEKGMKPVLEAEKGVLYIAKITNELYQWERVEVEDILDDILRVRLVDRGELVEIEKTRLYPITDEFATLPCQSIRCKLFGLTAVSDVESVLLDVSTLCDATQFYAVVVDKESLSVILYNESGLNMNLNVLLQAAQKLPPTSLPSADSVSTVYVQHVTSSGDVYVQLDKPINCVVASILELLSRRAEDIDAPPVTEISTAKRYLAFNPLDQKLYRASVISNPTARQQVAVHFIDTGNTEILSVSNLRELSFVCPDLENIPDLAVRVRLARIPPSPDLEFTDRAAKRLRELAPKDTPTLMRLIQTMPPLVDLYKRIDGSKELTYINTTLELDQSLFAPSTDAGRTPSPLETLARKLSTSSIGSPKGKVTPSPPPPPTTVDVISQLTLPAVGDTMAVVILNVSHPHNFWIQPLESNDKLESLMHKMQEWYNRPEAAATNVPKSAVQVNGFYAAMHQGTKLWHRIKVKALQGSSALVQLVDYGDTDILMEDRPVYLLKPEFCQLPCQAIQAKLAGVKPLCGDWSVEGILFFKQYEQSKLFGTIQHIVEQKVLVLDLIDTSGEDDVYISKLLLEKKLAAPE